VTNWSDDELGGVGYRWELWMASSKVIALLDAAGLGAHRQYLRLPFAGTSGPPDKFEMNEERLAISFEKDQQQGVKGFTRMRAETRGMIFTRRNGAERGGQMARDR